MVGLRAVVGARAGVKVGMDNIATLGGKRNLNEDGGVYAPMRHFKYPTHRAQS